MATYCPQHALPIKKFVNKFAFKCPKGCEIDALELLSKE